MKQIRVRAPARLVTLFAATVALTGCGGGDDSAASPPPPPPAPALFNAAAVSAGGVQTLVVVDADQASPPRLSVVVDDHLMTSGVVINGPARTSTYQGDSMVYYVRSGELFQVSLRKPGTATPQRISSLATACQVLDWHPLTFDGSDDAWIEVSEAGPDASCTQVGDNRFVYVRTGASTTTAATALPDGVEVLESLPDVSRGVLAGFIAVDERGGAPKLTYHDAGFALIGDVAGGAGLSDLAYVSASPGSTLDSSAEVLSGSNLRRLTWTASAATLGASYYTHGGGLPEAYVDANAMYFGHGQNVMYVNASGGVGTVGTLAPAAVSQVTVLGITSTHLLLGAQGGSGSSLYSMPKAGGTPQPLAAGTTSPVVYGMHGENVIYTANQGLTGRVSVRRVHISGSNDQVITANAGLWPIGIYNPVYSYAAGMRMEGMAWCEVPPAAVDCRNGSVRSVDFASGVITTLGTLSHTSTSSSWYTLGYGYRGQPLVFELYSFITGQFIGNEDMYLARPGTGGSLVRVTTHLP